MTIRASDRGLPLLSISVLQYLMVWDKKDDVANMLQPLPDSNIVMGNLVLWQVWVGYLVSKMVNGGQGYTAECMFYELFFLHSIIAVSGSNLFKGHLCLRLQCPAAYF